VKAAEHFPELRLLALTVITSLSDEDLPEIGLAPSVQSQVIRLAQLAADCGCHGVVASAQEAAYLKAVLPAGALIVCPGIQLPGGAGSDQARIASPAAARAAGASHIVVGRAITAAAQPAQAYAEALEQFAAQAGASSA
jgi:orotidine-5'-phosphate decarboxylase